MTRKHRLTAHVVVVVAMVVLAACTGGPSGIDDEFEFGTAISVDDLEAQVHELPGVVTVSAARTQADSDHWVVGVGVVVDDDISVSDLAAVLRLLGELGHRVDNTGYSASVHLADTDLTEPDASDVTVQGRVEHPERVASGFLTALDLYPEATVNVGGDSLSIEEMDPRGNRVGEILGQIAVHPVLGQFSTTNVSVRDGVEGIPLARVLTDDPLTQATIDHWQAVVDVVATTPPQAAPLRVSLVVRDGVIDNATVVLDGDLPDDVPPDFATWNPVIGPVMHEFLLLVAGNADPSGMPINLESRAGEFAGIYVDGTASPSQSADPVWSQWAADVVNAVL